MLLDELARMKAELAEREKEGQEEEKEEVIDEPKVEEEEKVEEVEEKPEEEKKAEPKEDKDELDTNGYMRLRREAAAAKRQAEQLEREVQELRNAKKEVEVDPAQEQAQISPEFQSVIEEHRLSRAEREFSMYEAQVRKDNPEYGAVASEYAQAMYQSIRLQNPRKSYIELNEMTKKAILMKAGEFARAGYENPVEEMYHEAKELGFTGKSFQKEEAKPEPKEEKLQPDLRKVAENRKRSTGMTANNGRSEGLMTMGAAADLSAAEWAKLPKAEKQRLLYGG